MFRQGNCLFFFVFLLVLARTAVVLCPKVWPGMPCCYA